MLAGASLSQDGPPKLMVALAKCSSSQGASVLAVPKEASSWPSAPLANSRLISTWSGVVTVDRLADQGSGPHHRVGLPMAPMACTRRTGPISMVRPCRR